VSNPGVCPVTFLTRRRLTLLGLGLVAVPAWARPRVPLAVGDHGGHQHWMPLFERLAQAIELEWELRPMPWPRAQTFAEQGEGLMFGLARTPAREARFEFSLPVTVVRSWAAVRRGAAAQLAPPGALAERTVCMARGSSYPDTLRAKGVPIGQWLESDQGDPGALRMLAAGRCDAAVLTLPGGSAELASRHLARIGISMAGLELLQRPLQETPLHFVTGLRSPWGWVLGRLNEALQRDRRLHETLQRLSG